MDTLLFLLCIRKNNVLYYLSHVETLDVRTAVWTKAPKDAKVFEMIHQALDFRDTYMSNHPSKEVFVFGLNILNELP